MDKKTLLIIVITIVIVVAILIWLLISTTTTPPPNDCSNPNSACGAVLSQQSELLAQCLAEQYTLFTTFVKESPQGFTQSEINTLNNQTQQCNQIALDMAKTAKSFNYNPVQALIQYVGTSLEIMAGLGTPLYFLYKYLKKYNFVYNYNGSTSSNIVTAAAINYLYDAGVISTDQASYMANTMNVLTQQQINQSYLFEQSMVLQQLTTLQAISAIEAAAEASMAANAAAISSVLASPPPPPPPPFIRKI